MKLVRVAACAALSVSAAAGAMPVDQFVAKADALRAKGFGALFSSDYAYLSDAIKADAAALKVERETATAAHRTPAYCPPGPLKMGSGEIMAVMQAVPVAERSRTDTRDTLRAYFASRFPCRA